MSLTSPYNVPTQITRFQRHGNSTWHWYLADTNGAVIAGLHSNHHMLSQAYSLVLLFFAFNIVLQSLPSFSPMFFYCSLKESRQYELPSHNKSHAVFFQHGIQNGLLFSSTPARIFPLLALSIHFKRATFYILTFIRHRSKLLSIYEGLFNPRNLFIVFH